MGRARAASPAAGPSIGPSCLAATAAGGVLGAAMCRAPRLQQLADLSSLGDPNDPASKVAEGVPVAQAQVVGAA